MPELREVGPDHWVACIRAEGYESAVTSVGDERRVS